MEVWWCSLDFETPFPGAHLSVSEISRATPSVVGPWAASFLVFSYRWQVFMSLAAVLQALQYSDRLDCLLASVFFVGILLLRWIYWLVCARVQQCLDLALEAFFAGESSWGPKTSFLKPGASILVPCGITPQIVENTLIFKVCWRGGGWNGPRPTRKNIENIISSIFLGGSGR